jgi:hypothetical protein
VTLSSSENFERIYEPGFDKIEKAIKFLKWRKEKYRLNYNKLTGPREVEELFKNDVKYGIQMKVNSFMVWKCTLKWSIYAEVTMFSGIVLFGNLKNKRKRRKVEVLTDIIQSSGLKSKIEFGKLYVLDKNRLKFLV